MNDFYCEQVLSDITQVKIVHETATVLAFHHTKPSWPVHIVVIPKKHISSLLELTDSDHQTLLDLFNVIKKVALETKNKYGACRILTNLGKYQDSQHLHWHISYGDPSAKLAI